MMKELLKSKIIILLTVNLFISSFAYANYEAAFNQAKVLVYETSKTYTEGQVLDFQDSVVDQMYHKLIGDSSYTLSIESEDFRQYIRAIGFYSMHSKHHNAGSYVSEIFEKTEGRFSKDQVWRNIRSILPASVYNKLRADYAIEAREPEA